MHNAVISLFIYRLYNSIAVYIICPICLPFLKLLPDSTGRTNDNTAITEKSRPYLSKSANGRQLCCPGGRATQVT